MKKKTYLKKVSLIFFSLLFLLFNADSWGGISNVNAIEVEIGRTSTGSWNDGYFYEMLTYELVDYNDSNDQGKYRIKYYIKHWSDNPASYTYQVTPAKLAVNGNHVDTFGDHVGERISNETRFMGATEVWVPAGQTHRFDLTDDGGGITQINLSVDVYLPYKKFTVKYQDYNGTELKTEVVEKYQHATAPANPTRVGHRFTGWSHNGENITSNLTITAQYDINHYDVNYRDYDGTLLKTQSVPYNGNAIAPPAPVRVGYTFTGWSQNGNNITANRDITAQYRINHYDVKFHTNGGTAINTQSIEYQSKAVKPTDPQKANHTFINWYTEPTFEHVYNFDNPIGANNITLYAKWDAHPLIHANDITIYDMQYTFDEWQDLKLQNVRAIDKEDGDISNNITITEDTTNLQVPGDYVLRYQVSDSVGGNVDKEVNVHVVYNHPPEITYKDYEFYEDEINKETWDTELLMKDVRATDKEDGNITSEIRVTSNTVDPHTPGIYHSTYQVSDMYHKTSTVTAIITIKYNNAPNISATNKKFYQYAYTNKEWKDKIIYEDVVATDIEDGDITDKLNILEDDVDMEVVGLYRVKYEIVDAYGKKDIKTIQVEVVYNMPPIIYVQNKSFYENEITHSQWQIERRKDVVALDSEDGDITDTIEIKKDNVNVAKAGTYEVLYEVVDSGGKTTTKTIDITIKKNHAPTLNIIAENKRFVEGQYTHDEWIMTIRMENVRAFDKEDSNITDKIVVISDDVDVNTAGTYEVTYEVTDKFNKRTEKTITVTVEENLPPVIHASERWFKEEDSITDQLLLENVIAYDDNDGNISKQVVVQSSTIVEGAIGDYTVTYFVSDSLGKSTTLTIPIHIESSSFLPPAIQPPNQPSDESAVIFANGRNYGEVELSKIMEESEFTKVPYETVVFGIYANEDIQYKGTVVLKEGSLVGIIRLDENQKGIGRVHHAGKYYVKGAKRFLISA